MSFRILITIIFILNFYSGTIAADTFVFTAIPDEDESKLRSRFDKIATSLAKALKTDVKYIREDINVIVVNMMMCR